MTENATPLPPKNTATSNTYTKRYRIFTHRNANGMLTPDDPTPPPRPINILAPLDRKLLNTPLVTQQHITTKDKHVSIESSQTLNNTQEPPPNNMSSNNDPDNNISLGFRGRRGG